MTEYTRVTPKYLKKLQTTYNTFLTYIQQHVTSKTSSTNIKIAAGLLLFVSLLSLYKKKISPTTYVETFNAVFGENAHESFIKDVNEKTKQIKNNIRGKPNIIKQVATKEMINSIIDKNAAPLIQSSDITVQNIINNNVIPIINNTQDASANMVLSHKSVIFKEIDAGNWFEHIMGINEEDLRTNINYSKIVKYLNKKSPIHTYPSEIY